MPTPASASREAVSASGGWLNRTTAGISLASLLSDISHELVTAVLPAFLLSLGAGPAALGWIEGSADGLSALAKLWGGVTADRLRRRKPLASIGYLVTGIGTAAIGVCTRAWQVMLCRAVAWIGRGSRSPARDVLMAEGSPAAAHGRAFGLERAGDALGAVLGPLLAMALRSAEPRRPWPSTSSTTRRARSPPSRSGAWRTGSGIGASWWAAVSSRRRRRSVSRSRPRHAASLLPPASRGAGMGLLAAANGVGDMVSSALVGTLWAVFPGHAWGFVAPAALQFLGAGRIVTGGNDHPPGNGIA